MCALRPVITGVDNDVVFQLALNVEVPLLRVWLMPLGAGPTHRLHAVVGRASRRGLIERRVVDGGVAHKGRVDEFVVIEKGHTRRLDKEAVAAAYRRLAVSVRIEGEAQPRLKSAVELRCDRRAVGRAVRAVST